MRHLNYSVSYANNPTKQPLLGAHNIRTLASVDMPNKTRANSIGKHFAVTITPNPLDGVTFAIYMLMRIEQTNQTQSNQG